MFMGESDVCNSRRECVQGNEVLRLSVKGGKHAYVTVEVLRKLILIEAFINNK